MEFLKQMADQNAATKEIRYRGHGAYINSAPEFVRNNLPRTLPYCPFSPNSPQGAFIVCKDQVYFVHKESQQVVHVSKFSFGIGECIEPDQIETLGTVQEALKRTAQAQQAKFLSDTTNPETTRRPERLNLITKFKQTHAVKDSTFDSIDPLECWVFQKRLTEAVKLLGLNTQENTPAPRATLSA